MGKREGERERESGIESEGKGREIERGCNREKEERKRGGVKVEDGGER